MMSDNIIDLSKYGGGPGAVTAVGLLRPAQLHARIRALRWLVKKMIPADSVGLLFGGSDTFKSFIALDLALHVAHGLPWLGKKTAQGPVVVIAAEGGSGIWRRIQAWHLEHGLPWDEVPLFVMPTALDLGTDASRVCEAVKEAAIEPALVIVDTMAATFGGEENSAGEVSGYLRELALWFRGAWQCSVLVIHHTGHSANERPRGSSALKANVDFMFGCYRDEGEMLATVECLKQKDGEKPAPTSFALSVRDIEYDEDGDKVTSLVAKALRPEAVVDRMESEAQRGRGGRNHLFLELALNGIEEKKLRTLFMESIDGDAETKRKAYFRARKWAIGAGLIEVAQGYVIRLSAGHNRDT